MIAMSWIKEEPLDENEYKFDPDLNQDLSQDFHKRHRNDHLDIIDSMKKEHSDDISSHSEVCFEAASYTVDYYSKYLYYIVLSFSTSL